MPFREQWNKIKEREFTYRSEAHVERLLCELHNKPRKIKIVSKQEFFSPGG